MAKGMRSKLLSKSTSLLYVLVFIVVAAGLYYLFRDNFRTREGQTASTTGPAQTTSPSTTKSAAAVARDADYVNFCGNLHVSGCEEATFTQPPVVGSTNTKCMVEDTYCTTT